MKISLNNAGKKYNREWVFKQLNYSFEIGNSYVIKGANGSGKSTLLQAIAGSIRLTNGEITWENNNILLLPEKIFSYGNISAPYLELIPEYTATEFLHFHAGFKKLKPNITIEYILQEMGLEKSSNKLLRNFSSGMLQKIKLAQAIFFEADYILLDEPCTNLDSHSIALYHSLIAKYCKQQLIIVASNNPDEYTFCTKELFISDYKG